MIFLHKPRAHVVCALWFVSSVLYTPSIHLSHLLATCFPLRNVALNSCKYVVSQYNYYMIIFTKTIVVLKTVVMSHLIVKSSREDKPTTARAQTESVQSLFSRSVRAKQDRKCASNNKHTCN